MVDAGERILQQMLRLHELRRRIHCRFVVSCGAGLAGLASCMVHRAADPDELGDALPVIGVLALSAFVLGMFDARDIRRLTAQIERLGKVLASLR